MRTTIFKTLFAATLAAVFVIGLLTVTSTPAHAYPTCGTYVCPRNLTGYTFANWCLHGPSGLEVVCELWKLQTPFFTATCYTNCGPPL